MTTVRVTSTPITVLPVSEQTGATYTFALADRLKVTKGNSGSAQTFTIPPNATVAFPAGTLLHVCQAGAGQVTIAAGAGVTVNSAGSALKLRAQYSAAVLWKETTNTWWVWGDVAP